MSLIVEFELSGPPLELPNAADEVPDVTLEIERWRRDDWTVHWYLWASGERLDRVTAAFEALSNTTDVGIVSGGSSRRLYRVTMDAQVERLPEGVLLEGTLISGQIHSDCLHLVGRVSSRDVLTGLWKFLRSNEMTIDVRRLSRETDDPGDRRLSEPQFEALVTAYEMGYFDESTRVTQAEIATEIGISRSAFSERLRRAQEQLVEAQLGVA